MRTKLCFSRVKA